MLLDYACRCSDGIFVGVLVLLLQALVVVAGHRFMCVINLHCHPHPHLCVQHDSVMHSRALPSGDQGGKLFGGKQGRMQICIPLRVPCKASS